MQRVKNRAEKKIALDKTNICTNIAWFIEKSKSVDFKNGVKLIKATDKDINKKGVKSNFLRFAYRGL